MKKLNRPIPVDVDETLVLWADPGTSKHPTRVRVRDILGYNHILYRHGPNIKLLKMKAARGHCIMVWSKNGVDWAERVVIALGLEKYVYAVADKPDSYIDDKDASEWMGQRVCLRVDDPWGRAGVKI